MYITDGARFLRVGFGKVKSDARPDQLITFTRCLHEALPIEQKKFADALKIGPMGVM